MENACQWHFQFLPGVAWSVAEEPWGCLARPGNSKPSSWEGSVTSLLRPDDFSDHALPTPLGTYHLWCHWHLSLLFLSLCIPGFARWEARRFRAGFITYTTLGTETSELLADFQRVQQYCKYPEVPPDTQRGARAFVHSVTGQ